MIILLKKFMISMKKNKNVFSIIFPFSYQIICQKNVVKLELQHHHWFTTGRKGKTITIQGSNE